MWRCKRCGAEYSAMKGDNEVPEYCPYCKEDGHKIRLKKTKKFKVYVRLHYIVNDVEALTKKEAKNKIHDINVFDRGSLQEVEPTSAEEQP